MRHSRNFQLRCLTATLLLLFSLGVCRSDAFAESGDIAPEAAIPSIVKALSQKPLVALGERHGVQEMADFYLALVADKDFRETADVIVIEIANARYQSLIDAYVSGENISMDELRPVWRDATNSLLQGGDDLSFEHLFAAIREGNLESDSNHQLRVLAGDPPLDWSAVQAKKDFYTYLNDRDRHYAEIVRNEVLQEGKRGVMIMGRGHLTYTVSNPEYPNAVAFIEKNHPGSMTIIHMLTDQPERLRKKEVAAPAIIFLEDTWLGETDAKFGFKRREGVAPPALNETIDAVLYLGDPSVFSETKLRAFDDPGYLAELDRRAQIIYETSYIDFAKSFGLPLPPGTE